MIIIYKTKTRQFEIVNTHVRFNVKIKFKTRSKNKAIARRTTSFCADDLLDL